tara:strand:+ start:163 stop:444 length:282 start_codon:yes stop_codon:yes gene_type:complete
MAKDLNKPLTKKQLEKLQKKIKGGSPGQVWKEASKDNRSKLAMAGPELPNIKKDLKGEIKGTIKGPRSGGRNDLKNKDWRKIQAKKKKPTGYA